MEKWYSLEFTILVSADPHFDSWLNLCCAIVALPVKTALRTLSTRISIVAGACILDNSVTINELFADRVGAVVLKRDDYGVTVIVYLLVGSQKSTLAKFEVLFDLLVLLTGGIQEIVVHGAAVFLVTVVDRSE